MPRPTTNHHRQESRTYEHDQEHAHPTYEMHHVEKWQIHLWTTPSIVHTTLRVFEKVLHSCLLSSRKFALVAQLDYHHNIALYSVHMSAIAWPSFPAYHVDDRAELRPRPYPGCPSYPSWSNLLNFLKLSIFLKLSKLYFLAKFAKIAKIGHVLCMSKLPSSLWWSSHSNCQRWPSCPGWSSLPKFTQVALVGQVFPSWPSSPNCPGCQWYSSCLSCPSCSNWPCLPKFIQVHPAGDRPRRDLDLADGTVLPNCPCGSLIN